MKITWYTAMRSNIWHVVFGRKRFVASNKTKQQLLFMLCLFHSLIMCWYIYCVYARTFTFELIGSVRARAQHTATQYTPLKNTINSCRFHCEGMSNSWKCCEFQLVLRTCGVNKHNAYHWETKKRIINSTAS